MPFCREPARRRTVLRGKERSARGVYWSLRVQRKSSFDLQWTTGVSGLLCSSRASPHRCQVPIHAYLFASLGALTESPGIVFKTRWNPEKPGTREHGSLTPFTSRAKTFAKCAAGYGGGSACMGGSYCGKDMFSLEAFIEDLVLESILFAKTPTVPLFPVSFH